MLYLVWAIHVQSLLCRKMAGVNEQIVQKIATRLQQAGVKEFHIDQYGIDARWDSSVDHAQLDRILKALNTERLPSPLLLLLGIVKVLLIGASVAVAVLLVRPKFIFADSVANSNDREKVCYETVDPHKLISKHELAAMLTIPEREPKDSVTQILGAPHCFLKPLELRKDALAVREAYPLEFDRNRWLIILSEGEEYAGYAILKQ